MFAHGRVVNPFLDAPRRFNRETGRRQDVATDQAMLGEKSLLAGTQDPGRAAAARAGRAPRGRPSRL